MQIEEHRNDGAWLITACAPGRIEINGESHNEAIVLDHNGASAAALAAPAELSAEHILQHNGGPLPEVVIVGTGSRQQFLHPKITAALAAKGIGLESMNTAAACRTVMVLQSEGRRVWAWLWP